MALHGRTKIELTDRRTGRVETVEHSNFITAAVAAYNKPLGGLTDAYGLLYGRHLLDYYGSVCLFDKALPGDENTFFPLGGATPVGMAEYGVANNTADAWLGSCNMNETKIDYANRTATLVFDFSTSQANGEIGAVCLAPARCGTGAVWGAPGSTTYARQAVSYTGSNDYKWHEIPLRACTAGYNKTTNKLCPVFWDWEQDVGYYINYARNPLLLEKHRLNLKQASLFLNQEDLNTTLLETHELAFDASCALYPQDFDRYDDEHFCMFGYTETNITNGSCAGVLYCFVFDLQGKPYKTIAVTSPCKRTRPLDMRCAYLNGYLLLAGRETESDGTLPIYRVPEENPTDIQPAECMELGENSQRYFKFCLGELYYFFDGRSNGIDPVMSVYNVATNRAMKANFYIKSSWIDDRRKQINLAGRPFYHLHNIENEDNRNLQNADYLYRNRIFLSTINNLDAPVTKTADKTMKITYTITEVAQAENEEGAG